MTIKDRRLFIYLSLTCLLACSPGSGNNLERDKTEDLKDKLEKILPDKVLLESVLPTDMDDYYEIHIEGLEPLYVTGNGKYLVSGDIYDSVNGIQDIQNQPSYRFQCTGVIQKQAFYRHEGIYC